MLPDLLIEPLVRAALTEDLGPMGDATVAAVIPDGLRYNSGLRLAATAFRLIDPQLQLTPFVRDGGTFAPGEPLLQIAGAAASILMAERVALIFPSTSMAPASAVR